MTCHDAREQFSMLVDDALTAGERAALDAHLATCADCRRELQRFRATVSLVRAVAPVRAPAGFVDRVLETARPVPWPRRLVRGLFLPWPVKLPIEAAAVVLVAVGVALVYRGTPELQQSARLEPPAPVVGRAPESTATPEFVAPGRQRETAPERKLDALRDQATAKDQARALAKTREAKEAPEPPKATERSAPPPAKAPQPETPSRDAEVREELDRRKRAPEVAGKLETPPAIAEQRALARQDVQAPRPPAARADSHVAAAPPAVSGAASSFAAPDVQGQLSVSDRDVALGKVGELVTRLGVIENRRVDGPDGPILELTIRRDAYAEFVRELARLGRWQPNREPSTLPAQLRVILRITG